jgi:hypothetical protein
MAPKKPVTKPATKKTQTKPVVKKAPVKNGRPTKYDDSMILAVEYMARCGLTDKQMAEKLGINETTFNTYKKQHEKFFMSIKDGKKDADDLVERSLFERATGYKNENAVKIFMPAGADEPVYAPYTDHVAPDVTAQIFWLKNRRPEQWRDNSKMELTGKDGNPLAIQVNFVKPK